MTNKSISGVPWWKKVEEYWHML